MSLYAEHATSIMQFCAAHREQYRQLLKTGDIVQTRPRSESSDIDRKVEQARQLIDREGLNVSDAAKRVGIVRITLYKRLQND